MESFRRLRQERAAAARARARAALDGGSCGLRLGGHSAASYNGTYEAVDEHDGWPVLKNEYGNCLFRRLRSPNWCLAAKHTQESKTADAYIIGEDGSFPIGEHAWNVWNEPSRSFEPRTLTMHVVVRV